MLENHFGHNKMTTQCVKFNTQYTVAVKAVGTRQKIIYIPEFMLRLTYFMRHGGVVFDEREYSWDLQQGGSVDLRASYIFLWESL